VEIVNLHSASNRNTQIEEKVGPDSRNTVEKNQTVLKESVSPLVKNEEEKEKEEEGMKLRRRSKIKVSVLFFPPVSFLYSVFSVVKFTVKFCYIGFNRENTSRRNG